MQYTTKYVKELEQLILDTLLPTYIKYQKSKGVPNPLQGINPLLIAQVKAIKKLPALLKEKLT